MTAVRLGSLGVDDALVAGQLLAASHADYPAFRHVFPERVTRERVLPTFMTATARDAARQGGALMARGGAHLLGVALWMPPGTFPLTLARKLRLAPGLLRVVLAAPLEFPAFARLGGRLERNAREESGWYLQAMGVHPAAQRSGIGSLLIAPVLDAADTASLTCHLHTSDPANVAYYGRHGFEVSDPAVRVGRAVPSYIAMRRSPHGKRS